MALTWVNLIILSAVIAVVLILIGKFWNLIKRFLQVWLFVVIILVAVKLALDAGWI